MVHASRRAVFSQFVGLCDVASTCCGGSACVFICACLVVCSFLVCDALYAVYGLVMYMSRPVHVFGVYVKIRKPPTSLSTKAHSLH